MKLEHLGFRGCLSKGCDGARDVTKAGGEQGRPKRGRRDYFDPNLEFVRIRGQVHVGRQGRMRRMLVREWISSRKRT